MAKGLLDGVAWDEAPVFGETGSAKVPVLVPEEPPKEATCSVSEAQKILGLSRTAVRHYHSKGRLTEVGKTVKGGPLFDRSQVEELAADREATIGDRRLTGSAVGQRALERQQNFTSDPRLLERGVRERAGDTRAEERHLEMITALRNIQEEISTGNQRITSELRLLDRRLTSIESSFASLNMGALMAALVAAGVAIAPDDLKQKAKDKFDGLVRPNGPHGAAAVTAAAVGAPTVAPEGPRLNVFGEPVSGPAMTEAQIAELGAGLNDLLTKARTTAS
jgi:DNA-binding transcriptional MerR regulator